MSMDVSDVRAMHAEHKQLVESIGYFNVKSVLLSLKIAQCYRRKDAKLYYKYVLYSFLGSLCVDITEEIQVDICCDLVAAMGHSHLISQSFKNLLASYIRFDDIFGLCNTLAAGTRKEDSHHSVWEHVLDVFRINMLQSLALEDRYLPFFKSTILYGYAELLRFGGSYAECLSFYEDSLKLRQELLSEGDNTRLYQSLVAQSEEGLGLALVKNGCFDDAERYFTDALSARNRLKKERNDAMSCLMIGQVTVRIADSFFARGETHLKQCQDWYEVGLGELEDVVSHSSASDVVVRRAQVLGDHSSGRLGYVIEMQAVIMLREANTYVSRARRHILNADRGLPGGHPAAVEIHEMCLFSDRIIGGVEAASDVVFSKLDCCFDFKNIGTGMKEVTGDIVRDDVDRIYNDAKALLQGSQLEESMAMLKQCIARAVHRVHAKGSKLTENDVMMAHPRLADCLYLQGQILRVQGRYGAALEKYDKAGKIHSACQRIVPHAILCIIGLAECSLGTGDIISCSNTLAEAVSILLVERDSDGDMRLPPQFQYVTGVNPVDNILTLAKLLCSISKFCLAKGYYEAAMCMQTVAESLQNKVAAEREYNIDADVAESQWLKAKVLLAVGRSEEAHVLATTALAYYRELCPATGGEVMHHKVADILLLLAETDIVSGNLKNASSIIVRALSIYRHVFPTVEHENISWAMYLTARTMASMGKHTQCEALYNEAMSKCRKVSTLCLIGIANSFQALGRFADAEDIYSKVSGKIVDKTHPLHLSTLLDMAKNQRLYGKYREARSSLESFSSLRCRGNYWADLVTNMSELSHVIPLSMVEQETCGNTLPMDARYNLESGELNRVLGLFTLANTFYEKALEITRNVHGTRHPLIAEILFYQVENLRDIGYSEKATIRPAKKALHLRKNLLGDDHVDVAYSLQSLADIDVGRGNFVEARMQLRSCLSTLEALLGNQSPAVASLVNSLGRLNTLDGEFTEARRHLEAALQMRIRIYGEYSAPVAESLNNISELYRLQQTYDDAESYCSRALNLFKHVFGDDHPRVLNAQGNMGLIMLHSAVASAVKEGQEMIDHATERLSHRSTGEVYILASHPWIKKFKSGHRLTFSGSGSRSESGNCERLFSGEYDEEGPIDRPGQGNSDKALTVKLKKLKSDNEYLKSKNDEYQRLMSSLKSQIRLLEVRVHNAEEISAGSKQMLTSLRNSHEPSGIGGSSEDLNADPSVSAREKSNKRGPVRVGSLAASLGYARYIVKQHQHRQDEQDNKMNMSP